jgi:hypothetical protein
MNERLEELADQATEYCKTQPREMARSLWEEKFAELIIKEVLAVQEQLIAEGHNAWHVNKPTQEHFGVE